MIFKDVSNFSLLESRVPLHSYHVTPFDEESVGWKLSGMKGCRTLYEVITFLTKLIVSQFFLSITAFLVRYKQLVNAVTLGPLHITKFVVF